MPEPHRDERDEYAFDYRDAWLEMHADDGTRLGDDAERARAEFIQAGYSPEEVRLLRRPVGPWQVAVFDGDEIVDWRPREPWE